MDESMTNWSGRLAAFGAGWRSRDAAPWTDGLRVFVAGWSVATPAAEAAAPSLFDRQRLADGLVALRGPLAAIRAGGGLFNPWIVAGLKTDERRNAAVLAALLSPLQTGDAGYRFVDALFRRIETPTQRLPGMAALTRGYRLRIEDCPLGQASERIDLTIDGDGFLVGIEVKINAGEGHDQFARYRRTIARRAADDRVAGHVILLARRRMTVKGMIAAAWSDVAVAARTAAAHDPDTAIARALNDFAAHVGMFGRKERK